MKKDIKLVFEDSKILEVYRGTTVREVLKELGDEQIISLRINGNAVDCDYEILEDSYVNYISNRPCNHFWTYRLPYVIILR